MARLSAGLLLYTFGNTSVPEVWLAHMGGPFWAGKNKRAWTIPKGEYEPGEDQLAAATREFEEEIGTPPPAADYARLGDFRQPSGKLVTVFTARTDDGLEWVSSNTFSIEFPAGSGILRSFPEVDAARWFTMTEAREKILTGQLPMLDALEASLRSDGDTP